MNFWCWKMFHNTVYEIYMVFYIILILYICMLRTYCMSYCHFANFWIHGVYSIYVCMDECVSVCMHACIQILRCLAWPNMSIILTVTDKEVCLWIIWLLYFHSVCIYYKVFAMKYKVSFTISVPLQYTAYLKIISWLYLKGIASTWQL
jgi:hypothetical protein